MMCRNNKLQINHFLVSKKK